MKLIVLPLLLAAVTAAAEPSLKKTTWRGIPAFSLSDGRCEAIIVPKLGGRVVSFSLAGGPNWLWLGEPGSELREPALHWGGDKTYIGPHSGWRFTLPRTWPAPDTGEHEAEVIEGGALRLVSPPWDGYDGARVTREFRFDAKGDFVITHSIAALPGSRAVGALWTISQTVPATTFVPLNPVSPYKDNYFWFAWSKPAARKAATVISPTLLRLDHVPGEVSKMGAHPPQPALAAVKDGAAFVQKADPQPNADYPEGADGAGLSLEVYHHDARGAGEYVELEFLSPLRRFDAGAQLTTRWSIHALPKDWDAQTIERLLTGK
jgi:hypothetical protein